MATLKQEKVARSLIDLRRKGEPASTIKDILLQAGYSYNTARALQRDIVSSKGVQEVLAKLGFNEDAAKAVAVKILAEGKEENQVKIIQEIFKVQGSYAPEKKVTLNFFDDLRKEIQDEQQPATPDIRTDEDDDGDESKVERPLLAP